VNALSWADANKYLLTGLLALLTALTYALGDTAVRVSAVLRPSVKTIVINRVVQRNNIREVVKETKYIDGSEYRETVREDRTETNTASSNASESTPVVPGRSLGWGLLGGGGRDLAGQYHVSLGASLGPMLMFVDNPVYEYELKPRLTLMYHHQF
jgi:hypothetical protein